MTRRLNIILTAIFLLLLVLPTAAQSFDRNIYVTMQRFERGLMLWQRDSGSIWVLVDDGRAIHFPSSSYNNLPDNPILSDPPDRLRPIFGFGQVWGNHADVREAIGWPTLPEIGHPTTLRMRDSVAYINELDGDVIRIDIPGSGTWRYVDESEVPELSSDFLSVTARPDPYVPGEEMIFTWEAEGTEFVLIEIYDAQTSTLLRLIEDLPLRGETRVEIPVTADAGLKINFWTANRALIGTGVYAYERIALRELNISVAEPAIETIETGAALQPYEGGFMIWREDSGSVLVFFSVGPLASEVQRFPQIVYETRPDNGETAPEGRVSPVNAFGKVWANWPQVKDTLGWAVAGEQGYTTTIRQQKGQPLSVTLPDGRKVSIVGGIWF